MLTTFILKTIFFFYCQNYLAKMYKLFSSRQKRGEEMEEVTSLHLECGHYC